MAAEAQAEGAVGIAVDGADNVYVLDTVNFEVSKYSPSGDLIGTWSCGGPIETRADRAVGVTVDGAGNVYLLDTATCRIRKYTPSGQFVGMWGFGAPGHVAEATPASAPEAAPPKSTSSPAAVEPPKEAPPASEPATATADREPAAEPVAPKLEAAPASAPAPAKPEPAAPPKRPWWQFWK